MKVRLPKKRLLISLVIFAVFYLATLLSPTPSQNKNVLSSSTSAPAKIQKQLYKVVKIVDGDTLDVEVNWKKQAVRLIGIETPEVVDPRKPVQCFGQEASNKAKELLSDKQIYLENDPMQGDKDKYKRLLRYIFLEDGTFLNKLMIKQGYAHEYTYESKPYKYQKEFRAAEAEARKNKKGLWADNICVTP